VWTRVTIAAIGLNIARRWRGYASPRDWPTIRALSIIGVGNVTIPYLFISFSEQNITSGMAAVLQATASLFSLIIAHLTFEDEQITQQKVLGLAVGFAGMILLSSQTISGGKIDLPVLLGQLGMIVASLCYAIFTVRSRVILKQNIEPLVISSVSFTAAAVLAGLAAIFEPLCGGQAITPISDFSAKGLEAILVLSFLNTFVAYLFFYFIVRELGAYRASTVTYVVPVVGLILGAWLLDEIVEVEMIIGGAMILAGITITNVNLNERRKRRSQSVRPA